MQGCEGADCVKGLERSHRVLQPERGGRDRPRGKKSVPLWGYVPEDLLSKRGDPSSVPAGLGPVSGLPKRI